MPLTVGVTLLPRLGSPPLAAFVQSALAGETEPPDLIAVGIALGAAAADAEVPACPPLDSLLPASVGDLLAAYGFGRKPGEICESAIAIDGRVVRVLFLGTGDGSARALRRAGAELARRCGDDKVAVADVTGIEAGTGVQAFTEGALLGGYGFSARPDADGQHSDGQHSEDGADSTGGGEIRLLTSDPEAQSQQVSRAAVIAEAVAVARDLANTPSAVKSPEWLAAEAARLTAGRGVEVRIRAEQELAAEGFGGILAVGAGSVRPPRLIELSYHPAGADRHVVLVGKGITFDSGGLSLKPTDGMKLMKTDMAGGGAVIAVMSALSSLGVRARVTGLVAAAENMPSGSAYRPGDVISQFGGRTVEVLNTDAEGRLVLADALAYAVATLAPDQIVDIATLTGAARVALGGIRAAVYATSDALADALVGAGQASGDLLWRMPLEDGYRPALDSPVADVAHVAREHVGAGSIVAALFLRDFVPADTAWAHLDIAGPGRAAADDGELSKGATGFGTRLLLSWLS